MRQPCARSLTAGLLVLLAACGASRDSTPEKPARLHAPPLTPDIVATRGERQSEYYERQVILINKWIKQSGISPLMAAGLLDVVRQSRDQTGKMRNLNAGDLVTDLQSWFAGAQHASAAGRAAAYVVGDRVLRLAWRPLMFTDPGQQQEWRDTLKAMGAESFYSQAAGEVEYPGSWLHAAIQQDPSGPLGQRAALLLIETDCAGGSSPADYYGLIARLDTIVASPADSEVRVTALLLEADAYRDIVALAGGIGRTNADSSKFSPAAPAARAKALTLYQTALALDSTSRIARGGRLAQNRLASGQPLDDTRFFCFAE